MSAKSEYAVKALLDLALHAAGDLQPIQDIAARQGIPQRYLEQVLLGLKRAGFLMSRRGSACGYRLGRPADQITVGAVLRAVEGTEGGDAAGPEADARPSRIVAAHPLLGRATQVQPLGKEVRV